MYLKYITNFPIKSYFSTNGLSRDKRIFCKNFFILVLFLEYISFKKRSVTFKYVCLPSKKSSTSFLRAPNRAKSSQVLLSTQKYFLLFVMTYRFSASEVTYTNIDFFIFLLRKKIKCTEFFESSNFFYSSLRIFITYNYNLK